MRWAWGRGTTTEGEAAYRRRARLVRVLNRLRSRTFGSLLVQQTKGLERRLSSFTLRDVLDETFQPQAEGRIRCQQQLGGIIKHYYRDAA